MHAERCFRFTHAIAREPGDSVAHGLRDRDQGDPSPEVFRQQHAAYVAALREAGVRVDVLPADEDFPDSVFVEDTALCIGSVAILMRPAAPERAAEPSGIRGALSERFDEVLELPDSASVSIEAGDILLSDRDAFIGLSARTSSAGFDALAPHLERLGYRPRRVETPAGVLHFKTDCGLLDSETIFATRRLAASGCFDGYRVVEVPEGEEAAANLIRVNDRVILASGHPRSADRLDALGFRPVALPLDEAAKIDGGPSCLSLRYRPANRSS